MNGLETYPDTDTSETINNDIPERPIETFIEKRGNQVRQAQFAENINRARVADGKEPIEVEETKIPTEPDFPPPKPDKRPKRGRGFFR